MDLEAISKIAARAAKFADNEINGGNGNKIVDTEKERQLFNNYFKDAEITLEDLETLYEEGLISPKQYKDIKAMLSATGNEAPAAPKADAPAEAPKVDAPAKAQKTKSSKQTDAQKAEEVAQRAKEREEIAQMYRDELAKLKEENGKKIGDVNYDVVANNVEKQLKESGKLKTSYYKDELRGARSREFVEIAEADILRNLQTDRKTAYGVMQKDLAGAISSRDEIGRKAAKDAVYNQDIHGILARKNTFEENRKKLENISEAEVRSILGKDLFEKLKDDFEKAGFKKGNAYDLTAVADMALNRTGSDYQVNRHDDKKQSERDLLHGDYNAKFGGDITEKEAQKITEKLCKLPYEHAKAYGEQSILPIAGGMATGAATGSLLWKVAVSAGVDAVADVVANGQALATAVATAQSAVTVWVAPYLIPAGIILGAVIPALLTRIFGKAPSEESYLNPEKLAQIKTKDDIRKVFPERDALMLEGMLDFIKIEGNKVTIDMVAAEKFIKENCGEDSPMNRKEMVGGARKPKAPATPAAPADEPEHEAVVTMKTPQVEQEKTEEWDKTHIHERKYGDTWKGIVEAYFPEMVAKHGLWGKNGAIKMLQRALCTDENGVFDAAQFNKLVTSTNLPKEILVPSKIGEFERAINPVKPNFDATKGTGKASGLRRVGHEEKGVDVTKVMVDGKPVYIAKDKEDPTQRTEADSKSEAVAKLEEKTGYKYKTVTEE